MKSTASAVWEGGLKDGNGTISAGGGAFNDTPYSFARRFESSDVPGTTPEEMIAAAHASCFAMATSSALGNAGFKPVRLAVTATVNMQPVDGKPTILGSHLELTATIPGIDHAKFLEIADGAKTGCVISRALKVPVTLEATLGG